VAGDTAVYFLFKQPVARQETEDSHSKLCPRSARIDGADPVRRNLQPLKLGRSSSFMIIFSLIGLGSSL
jgi:hypothetical protein